MRWILDVTGPGVRNDIQWSGLTTIRYVHVSDVLRRHSDDYVRRCHNTVGRAEPVALKDHMPVDGDSVVVRLEGSAGWLLPSSCKGILRNEVIARISQTSVDDFVTRDLGSRCFHTFHRVALRPLADHPTQDPLQLGRSLIIDVFFYQHRAIGPFRNGERGTVGINLDFN